MAARAALVTGASSGIGLAIARMLGEEGYELTVVGRRPEKLEQAAAGLEAEGIVLQAIAADVGSEEAIVDIVGAHESRFGRLDVLINNAGVGFGELADGLTTKRVDMQLNVNLRSIFLFYRECLPMLRKAAEEHKEALVVNLSSISGIRGEAFLSVYSATKHGVIGFTQAMNKELGSAGIRNTALCPGFVDTPMTDFIKEHVPAEEMIRPEDIAGAVRYLLSVSPGCMIPEIQFEQPGGLQIPGIGQS
ncbi:MAG: SDR family NAD(P)-dependent oxidoreductase [Solirubrobacterales bacterium]